MHYRINKHTDEYNVDTWNIDLWDDGEMSNEYVQHIMGYT